MKKYLDNLKKMLERSKKKSKKASSMCSIHCIPEMPRHKDKGDREYIKEKKIQKGQKRIQAGIVSAVRGCSHITSAKIRGSWTPLFPLRQQWSAFG